MTAKTWASLLRGVPATEPPRNDNVVSLASVDDLLRQIDKCRRDRVMIETDEAEFRGEVREAQSVIAQRSAELKQRYEDCDARSTALRLQVIGIMRDHGIVAELPPERTPMTDVALNLPAEWNDGEN